MPYDKKTGIFVPRYAWANRAPHARQLAAIKLFDKYDEVFYGGAAGGG